jgi:hypothetical protein
MKIRECMSLGFSSLEEIAEIARQLEIETEDVLQLELSELLRLVELAMLKMSQG